MKLRYFLRIMIPVCALATVSCTNEELILEASQTQRGRDFAQAFKARFDNIDPNHTWIDGTVGKVMVTTDEKANITIYGLGRSDNAAIRLKRCVVDGTQEVHYDIPMGCETVVIRAWNEHGNAYKTLSPTNQEDEATLLLGSGSRAASINNLQPKSAQMIDNVWNYYGKVAPWQTVIPNTGDNNIIAKFDTYYRSYDPQNGNDKTDGYKPGLGMCFYFKSGDSYYNIYNPAATTFQKNGKVIYDADFTQLDGNYKANFIPTGFFENSDEKFCEMTGFTMSDKVTSNNSGGKWQVVYVGGDKGNLPCQYVSLDNNNNYITTQYMPEGYYFNFDSFGKRGSWFNQSDEDKFGKFYVTNGMLSSNDNSYFYNPRDKYENYYNVDLNGDIINEINDIFTNAEGNYTILRDFNTDEGITTVKEGPVTVSWFYSETTTRDYIGYYYTEAGQPNPDIARKYLLLEASCTNRTQGDTFPLTYYGPNGEGSATFEFPKGVTVHFFILHGRDSSTNNPNPHSSYQNWQTGDPVEWVGTTETTPGHYEPNSNLRGTTYDWLFYGNDGWTLNAYYVGYSHAKSDNNVNDVAMERIRDVSVWNADYATPANTIYDEYDGVYKPMVAFKYAGYNVIGFEDTPIQNYGNTLDWNDVAFIVNGNFDVPDINERDLAFSMCMEDLGGTDDLDYNDLYMIVIQGYEEVTTTDGQTHQSTTEHFYAPPKVIVDMAGGILPLKIAYVDELRTHLTQTLFEDVHKAFGIEYAKDKMKYATVGQRSTINTFEPNSSDPKNPRNALSVEPAYSAGEISKVSFTDGSVVRCTNVRSLGDSSKNGHIETWFDASRFTSNDQATFSIIENIPNFKIYVTYNEGEDGQEEVVCISGPKNVQVGGEGKDDRIPYAFWFPSTAESEQQSEANPDSRVHPGFERQFIGDYLPDFNAWVADQTHASKGKTNWYHWMWGETNPENNQGSTNQGGGNNPAQLTTSTISVNASTNKDYYEIPASAFSNATTTVYVKLNYSDTEHYKWSNWVINESTVLNPSGILENYVTEDLSNRISDLKQYGLRIEWWSEGQEFNVPNNIQIIYK